MTAPDDASIDTPIDPPQPPRRPSRRLAVVAAVAVAAAAVIVVVVAGRSRHGAAVDRSDTRGQYLEHRAGGLWIRDWATGRLRREVEPMGKRVEFGFTGVQTAAVAPDGTAYYVIGEPAAQCASGPIYARAEGEERRVVREAGDGGASALQTNGKVLVWLGLTCAARDNENGVTLVHVLDLQSQREHTISITGADAVLGLTLRQDGVLALWGADIGGDELPEISLLQPAITPVDSTSAEFPAHERGQGDDGFQKSCLSDDEGDMGTWSGDDLYYAMGCGYSEGTSIRRLRLKDGSWAAGEVATFPNSGSARLRGTAGAPLLLLEDVEVDVDVAGTTLVVGADAKTARVYQVGSTEVLSERTCLTTGADPDGDGRSTYVDACSGTYPWPTDAPCPEGDTCTGGLRWPDAWVSTPSARS